MDRTIMEGIVKSAPVVHVKEMPQPVNTNSEPISRTLVFEGVPVDVLHYFNIDMEDLRDIDRDHIASIVEILRESKTNYGDVLKEIRAVENRVGQPTMHETRCGKIYHYLKLSQRINDLENQRKAMEYGKRY
jgi:hypothetical protein